MTVKIKLTATLLIIAERNKELSLLLSSLTHSVPISMHKYKPVRNGKYCFQILWYQSENLV